ncbi:MAG: hypothetical protein JOY60_11590 [Burkholderiaceae bacterium]|nr:hypothetical protein [Roseateles sp.]MBV8470485.1 hypothetical protein [Burkholderiaceae bacterium]
MSPLNWRQALGLDDLLTLFLCPGVIGSYLDSASETARQPQEFPTRFAPENAGKCALLHPGIQASRFPAAPKDLQA